MLCRLCHQRSLLSSPILLRTRALSPTLKWSQNTTRHRLLTSTLPTKARFGGFTPPPREDLFRPQRWDLRTKVLAITIVGGAVYYISHLEQVPVTGRWRFMDISAREEAQLAAHSYQELVSEFKDKLLPPNHPLSVHVRRIVSRILESSELGRLKDESGLAGGGGDEFSGGTPGDTWSESRSGGESGMHTAGPLGAPLQKEWNVFVVNDPTVVNAMATNGNVVVFTGILPVCQDEHGLAAVIGHEIAHVVARHPSERLSSITVFTLLALLIDFLLPIDFELGRIITTITLQFRFQTRDYKNWKVGFVSFAIFILLCEITADRIGLSLTARACYDPQGAPRVQKHLAMVEKKVSGAGSNIGFLRTHPHSDQRAQILESYLADAYAVQAASPLCAGIQDSLSTFRETVTGVGQMVRWTEEREGEWAGEEKWVG